MRLGDVLSGLTPLRFPPLPPHPGVGEQLGKPLQSGLPCSWKDARISVSQLLANPVPLPS